MVKHQSTNTALNVPLLFKEQFDTRTHSKNILKLLDREASNFEIHIEIFSRFFMVYVAKPC